MVVLDLKGLPASERRPRIAEAVNQLQTGESAIIVIQHEDFWTAIPKTIEGFASQVDFESITFENNYQTFNVLIHKNKNMPLNGQESFVSWPTYLHLVRSCLQKTSYIIPKIVINSRRSITTVASSLVCNCFRE